MADLLDVLTLAEAKTAANLGDGFDSDTELALWITAMSRRLDQRCGPVVVRTITDELHDGGDWTIWPVWAPVQSVTEVVEYDRTVATTLTAETNDTKPQDGYGLDGWGRYDWVVRRRSSDCDLRFPHGRRNVKITYVAGRFATTEEVDARFKMAAGSIVRRFWQREQGAWARGGDPFAEAGAGTVGFFKAIDPMIDELLPDEVKPPVVG